MSEVSVLLKTWRFSTPDKLIDLFQPRRRQSLGKSFRKKLKVTEVEGSTPSRQTRREK